MSDEFKELAIKRQVKELFSRDSFYIHKVDNLADMLGVVANRKIHRELEAYSCVSFADMTDREKELLQEKVVECLRGDQVLNPARVLRQLTDEGRDFAFSEDRYIDTPNVKRIK